MLYDPARHEALQSIAWNEAAARAAIERIVRDTEERFSPQTFWPLHPRDADDVDTRPLYPLYFGATGVIWALHQLQDLGAATLQRSYAGCIDTLLALNTDWRQGWERDESASYLMGDTGVLMLGQRLRPTAQAADRLEQLIAGNLDNPTRELLWGAPGTMLAALFLYRHSGEPRWAELFRRSARTLWSQLLWSPEHACHYWMQDMYGRHSSYLDAVHGFAGTALALLQGRDLLDEDEWREWQACIANTVRRSATWDGAQASWRAFLLVPEGEAPRMLMQFCHGAPGFVVCLADWPNDELDDLLLAAGEATWAAGPLAKGSNLCHGTGGNGYAFLKLHRRTGDPIWLQRARAFAMHGIAQTEADAERHGQLRYSLWTGDPGFALYLWDCIHATAAFPTLDSFFGERVGGEETRSP
jgi:lantibiotic modifying enzyme